MNRSGILLGIFDPKVIKFFLLHPNKNLSPLPSTFKRLFYLFWKFFQNVLKLMKCIQENVPKNIFISLFDVMAEDFDGYGRRKTLNK